MLKSSLKILSMLSLILLSSIMSYEHGVNVGMTLIADRVGPALYQCVNLIYTQGQNR